MEEFLNAACSDENLVELIAVLKGDESLDPALREVARLISRHYESKIDFHESLAFARARDAERNSGRPHEKLIKKCKEDLEAIETASRATLILFVERLITEQLQSDHTLVISGSLSGKMPSKEMIEGMRIQTRRREMQRHAVCARLETLIYRGKTGEAPAVTGVSQEGW